MDHHDIDFKKYSQFVNHIKSSKPARKAITVTNKRAVCKLYNYEGTDVALQLAMAVHG